MSIYLHHYPASPFSEKVRAMLGYLSVAWRSVEIPNVMPRPLLAPLSGGYRRTPCLQIGANVYCDSAAIARGLARHTKDSTMFAPGFVAQRTAAWADTQLFRVAVALNFRPEAVGGIIGDMKPEEIAAFGKDRAELTAGSSLTATSPAEAQAVLNQILHEFEGSLSEPFLFGAAPSIADFSIYHCLWFLENNPLNAPLLAPFKAVRAWMARLAAFGHGDVAQATGEEALAHAKQSEPVLPDLESALPDGFSLGDCVSVTPTDYGLVPVTGTLAACAVDEIVLEREAPKTGRVMTHFPSAGFELAKG